ncbi:E3 ubiquitin-protein ligase rififylin [Tachyglossus aculeatus]|uniref:E3 ubiquitin-protein ligase rififylin n=1 Tax=Tachyglossus aculeatus TaxID=9261 RepID=UPI0018F4F49D|nr:E3 ubiquitin-protein ligase rififylin [Tachyglossus aculeatus]XP_038615304.1 E3 ubiquitin-protein ligase rififylin [Tachyglossus aculeatus]
MWAACCNWFCLDGQPEPPPQPLGARARAYSNPGFSAHPSPTEAEPACRACGRPRGGEALELVCLDCRQTLCPSCCGPAEAGPLLCPPCRRVRATAFRRDELMKMKVKELRDYLARHGVSSETCREKEDLVHLVTAQRPAAGPPTAPGPLPRTQEDPQAVPPASPGPVRPAGHVPRDGDETERPAAAEEDEPREAGAEPEVDASSADSDEAPAAGRRASLSDLGREEDVEALSVRQLKEILARNFVNYKGCCEKRELMERVTRLFQDRHRELQHLGRVAALGLEENLCKICMDSPIDCVLLECGHMVTCTKCGKRMSECPICRQYVIRAVHVFRS